MANGQRPHSAHSSPCQFVPATPSLHRHLCRSPAAQVPMSPLSMNYDSPPSPVFRPLGEEVVAASGSVGITLHAMEYGERIVFLPDSHVTPQSGGAQRSTIEQIVPATPVRNITATRNTHLLTSSTSTSREIRDVRGVHNRDVSRKPAQSRARKQKQRFRRVLRFSRGASCPTDATEYEDTYISLFAGSQEDIFL